MTEQNLLHLLDQAGSVNPILAVVLCVLALCCLLPCWLLQCMVIVGPDLNEDRKIRGRGESFCILGHLLELVCLFTALILFLCYSGMHLRRVHPLEQYDYVGDARIVGINYNRREKVYTGDGPTAYVDPVLTLDWGYEWACKPQNSTLPPKQCHSTVEVCGKSASGTKLSRGVSDEFRDSAMNKAKSCVWRKFGFKDGLESFAPYDPNVAPYNDLDWPSIRIAGDCSTCEVTNIRPLEQTLLSAYIILGLGLFCGASLLVWALYRKYRYNEGRSVGQQSENVDATGWDKAGTGTRACSEDSHDAQEEGSTFFATEYMRNLEKSMTALHGTRRDEVAKKEASNAAAGDAREEQEDRSKSYVFGNKSTLEGFNAFDGLQQLEYDEAGVEVSIGYA